MLFCVLSICRYTGWRTKNVPNFA